MANPKSKIAIIGGGASGLTAAIECARVLKKSNCKYEVIVFEKLQRVGKKILVTGNGRCNLSNEDISIDFYHGDTNLAKESLNVFGTSECIDFFNSIGIVTKTESSRIYPASSSANSVLDCLRLEAQNLSIQFANETPINNIKKAKNGFVINNDINVDKVIIATGGKSASVHGSDGSGYKLLQNFGHKLISPLPSLVQMNCSDNFCKQLKGVRANASITLFNNNEIIKKECGEIQFTDYGLSGIACMQVSRYVNTIQAKDKNSNFTAMIDLAEEMSNNQIKDYINTRIEQNPSLECENLLIGMLNKKLSQVILKVSNIKPLTKHISNLTKQDIDNITKNIKQFKMHITGTKDFKSSQVTAGGISLKDFSPLTFESKKQSGLYACGEVLNIDGDCGGYNLQWAWCSGYLAGKSCAKEIINA